MAKRACVTRARWRYTQSGINAAARVVEVVSGMPFDDFVQRRILDPLGMKDTTFDPMLSPGTFGHGGAWGTQAWIDPARGVAYILMRIEPLPYRPAWFALVRIRFVSQT